MTEIGFVRFVAQALGATLPDDVAVWMRVWT